jgi:hypothetical protein
MRRVAAALMAVLLVLPATSFADSRDVGKTVLQTAGGASAGLVLGGAAAFVGLVNVLCETDDCGNEDLGLALVFGSPLVFAAGEAAAVHLIGRHFDGREARLWPTFGGAVLGTAAGTALWLSTDQSTESFIGGVALATAGTVAGYALGRDRSPRLGTVKGVEMGMPTVQPRLAFAPDGKAKLGADVRLLDLRF